MNFKNIFSKLLLVFIIITSGFNNTFSLNINPKLEKIYNKFILKVDEKYKNNLEKQTEVFLTLENKIIKLKNLDKYKNNEKILDILDQFLYLNNIKIGELEKDIAIKKYLSGNNKEIKEESLEEENEKILNDYEKKYKDEIEKNKKIIDSYSYSKHFKNKVYNKNYLFLKNGVWYTYSFKNFSFFPEGSDISLKDLQYNNINLDKAILFVTDNNTLAFVHNPKEIRLISDNIIRNIDNKYYFLEQVRNDLKNAGEKNYDETFKKLKEYTYNITKNRDDEQKIMNIYAYIINNIEYSKIIDFSNYKIFSGIETFINKDGVCEGYVKLMVYMLLFGGVNDAEVIKGYVIDAPDFPQVGHAWLRIGDKFYDPTFDDPVGALENKAKQDYMYFDMPKDLIYTNRYDKNNLPENIKTLSLEERKRIILNNLGKLLEKYKNSDYKILEFVRFKKDNNIGASEKITISNFNKIIDMYIVNDFSFNMNGKEKKIKKFNYYDINDNNLENILKQLNYDLDRHYFFKWYDEDGKVTYKLAYNLLFQ